MTEGKLEMACKINREYKNQIKTITMHLFKLMPRGGSLFN